MDFKLDDRHSSDHQPIGKAYYCNRCGFWAIETSDGPVCEYCDGVEE